MTVDLSGPRWALTLYVSGASPRSTEAIDTVRRICDEDLEGRVDLRALLAFLTSDEGKAELEGIGGVSKATVGVLLRNLVTVETGGGTEFFGEPMFDIADLMRTGPDGRGVISCMELPAVQDKPALWSTVLMWLVAELFETDDLVRRLTESGIAVDPSTLEDRVTAYLYPVLAEATLDRPETHVRHTGGRRGIHTEAMGYLLAEMQHLARSHPGATW